jgi:hypothetical protein
MGDASDMAELGRVMRSEEGGAYLESLAEKFRGRTIVDVDFVNHSASIGLTLELDDGAYIGIELAELDISPIRERFEGVIEREYHVDFPGHGRDPEP